MNKEALNKKVQEALNEIKHLLFLAEAYRLFRGRDANIEALMRDRGFPFE